MKAALLRLYERLWRPTAGRPYTYEARAWTARHPRWALAIALPASAALVAGQAALTMEFGLLALPFVLFADFAAFVAGHIWFDTAGAYIKGKSKFFTPH